MRASLILIAVAVAAAPTLAQAGVHMHLPHKARHHNRTPEPANGAPAPTTDIPDPVWNSSNTHR